jgi:hypothetical protein
MPVYQEYFEKYSAREKELKKRLNGLSFSRLIIFLLFLYAAYRSTQTGSGLTIFTTILLLAIFFIVVKIYDRLQQKMLYYATLAKYNRDEISFLETGLSLYPNGGEYQDTHHPWSYDLDIFGEGGLYASLNRCSSPFGRNALAEALLNPNIQHIPDRQAAIAELAGKIEFRQQLYAHGSQHQSLEEDLRKLMAWKDDRSGQINKLLYYLLLIFPLVTIGSLVFYFITDHQDIAFRIFYMSFILNLLIAFSFAKKITRQLSFSTSVTKILHGVREQLRLIEQEKFESHLLRSLQERLKEGPQPASQSIRQLASLMEYLESIINLLVSVLLNGLFLFHVHVLYRLGRWKQKHAIHIAGWMDLLGEIESLSSFANLTYNNPGFCFPEISKEPEFQAWDLGHVLIRPEKRISNDYVFKPQRFVILTGSNMSGKSTFLRTLGINLVLARAGSSVCASRMTCYPFDIFVSMRITDSLQDSESFFYAELKRLQAIIQHLQEGHQTFVILDEILRGTNSDDKRNGTIGLIRKMAGENTFGIIATHDTVVAQLANEYPDYIINKAFESRIINDELLFDYKLKDGVCRTLSASFLMKKLGVIDP